MGCEKMFERLDAMDAKYEELLNKQSSNEVLNDFNLAIKYNCNTKNKRYI